MKKAILFISTITLIIAICFSVCYKFLNKYINYPVQGDEIFVYQSTQEYSTKESLAKPTTEKGATTSESTTKKKDDSDSIARSTEQKSERQTTTKKATTTLKSIIIQRQTTTKKSTTTKKQTTTKKVTTTEVPYFCDEGGTHHSCDVGQIGWVDSFDTATDKALEYAGNNGSSGNFRVKQCLFCGKYTAYITFD